MLVSVRDGGGGWWVATLLTAGFRGSPSQPESGPGNEALCKLPRMVGPILNSVSIVLRTETVVTVLGSGYWILNLHLLPFMSNKQARHQEICKYCYGTTITLGSSAVGHT